MSVRDYKLPDALMVGKAGEHLVCSEMLMAGYHSFLADQGSPFDIVVATGDQLWRVQVKTTQAPKNVNARGRNERLAYSWSVRRRGKSGSSRLDEKSCDLVALVAMDIKSIAWFPISIVGETVQLTPPGHREARTTRDTG